MNSRLSSSVSQHRQIIIRRFAPITIAILILMVVVFAYSSLSDSSSTSSRWEVQVNKFLQSMLSNYTYNYNNIIPSFYNNKNDDDDKCLSSNDWSQISAETMTPSEIIKYLHWGGINDAMTLSAGCRLSHDFGGKVMNGRYIPRGIDGQKSVCIDPPSIAPRTNGRCVVYSIGINNEWSFDKDMEAYGCTVFAFDPSMNVSAPYFDHSERIHFFNLALDSTDSHDGKRLTLDSINSMLAANRDGNISRVASGYHDDDEGIIDYLKIDVEAAEWDILPQILQSPKQPLSRVKQMGIEIHIRNNLPGGLNDYRRLISILKSIEKDPLNNDGYGGGMIRFSSRPNPWCVGFVVEALDNYNGSTCFELAWLNSKFL